MSIQENLSRLRATIPAGVTLVAVSKTWPAEAVLQAYDAGQRVFGENRVQELVAKAADLPGDIQWHLIGHLQRNKVKQVLPHVALIHSIDSTELLERVDCEAGQLGRRVDVLLQVHIAQEEAKTGFSYPEAEALLQGGQLAGYRNVTVRGLMGVATFTDNMAQVKAEFEGLHALYVRVREAGWLNPSEFNFLSMGMSGDYQLAIACGATMVRVGSLIFGHRDYGAGA